MRSWFVQVLSPLPSVSALTEVTSNPSSRNQKSFTPNSAKFVQITPGTIARLHFTDRRKMVFAERAVRRVKKNNSAFMLQSGLNERWWADSTERNNYLRNVTDFLFDGGRRPKQDVLDNH